MTTTRYASVSVIEKAAGCCERWQADLAAIRALFRQQRREAPRAAAQGGACIRLKAWCLRRYLANNPDTPPPPPDGDKG